MAATKFYFALEDAELEHLKGFTNFEKQLLSALAAVFKTGLIAVAHESTTPLELNTVFPEPLTQASKDTRKYVESACKGHRNGDKFISLRLLAPSLRSMSDKRNRFCSDEDILPWTKLIILQLLVWRTFAFGDESHLHELTINAMTSAAVIVFTVESWIENQKLMLGAYGNFMVNKHHIGKIVGGFMVYARAMAPDVKHRTMTFKDMYEELVSYELPHIPRGGLIAWLVCCDFSEYKICQPPTVKDLETHLDLSKTSGPTKAFEQISKWSNGGKFDDRRSLQKILDVFGNPPAGMIKLKEIVDQCEQAQGRKLNVADLEHGICKIGRMLESCGDYLLTPYITPDPARRLEMGGSSDGKHRQLLKAAEESKGQAWLTTFHSTTTAELF